MYISSYLKWSFILKFGIRKPSLKRSIATRTSPKRILKNKLGMNAKRGSGWITDPIKAAYNRVYNRTSFSILGLLKKLLK